jgi:hypothetical protein
VDLVGGSAGKLKVVALDPADSMSVIESNELTYNGGVAGNFAPTLLRATSIHQSLQLQLTVVGTDLNDAMSLNIVAPDGTWDLPLAISARSGATVTGVASVAALLPACRASFSSAGGAFSELSLPADPEPTLPVPEGGTCSAQYFEELLAPPPAPHGYTIQPKDFAFTPGFVDAATNQYALHVFYIRHNYWYSLPAPAAQFPAFNEVNIGHAWTSDFTSWHGPTPLDRPDTAAVMVRPNKFDQNHVWAPTIVRNGPIFHMFYTGVQSDGPPGPNQRSNQRIGVATSTDLNTWTPVDTAIFTSPQIPWASKNPSGFGGQQLRDPFVMQDPTVPGQWLMFFVAVDSLRFPRMAVGAAKSSDLRKWTALKNPFSTTERPTFLTQANRIESPHVFRRNGKWWLPYTVDGDQVFFETIASSTPADSDTTHWSNPIWLRGVSQSQPAQLQYWHATEHLGDGAYEYLAAWNDNATSIEFMGMFAPTNPAVDSVRLGCPVQPPTAGVDGSDASRSEPRLVVSRLHRGSREVGLRMELPSRLAVRLAVYDIAGRRRSTLVDRELPAGVTETTWDGTDDSGVRVASGLYFIRLTCVRGAQVSKLVMLR